MIGVIDVGGGTRGAFGAGVLDYCMQHQINFDYCAGVSAGAANISSYVAGQAGRNYKFYTDYGFRREYMGWANFLKRGYYVNLDYIYSTLSNADGEYPLDYEAIAASDRQMVVVATDARTGRPHYFTKADMKQDNYGIVKASCCVPVIDRPYPVKGRFYFDGGLSDPIPLQKAFDDGCDKVVVILTKPRNFYRTDTADRRMALGLRKFPKSAEDLRQRARLYNEQLDLCKRCEKEGRVLIIAPYSTGRMKTLTQDKEAIKDLYRMGYQSADPIAEFVQK